jgi:hypothetical protein
MVGAIFNENLQNTYHETLAENLLRQVQFAVQHQWPGDWVLAA